MCVCCARNVSNLFLAAPSIQKSAVFKNNVATSNGGAISSPSYATFVLPDNTKFKGNYVRYVSVSYPSSPVRKFVHRVGLIMVQVVKSLPMPFNYIGYALCTANVESREAQSTGYVELIGSTREHKVGAMFRT